MKVANESLLNRLRRLYTEYFLVILHNRILRYHPPSRNYYDISRRLHKLIDEIVEEISCNYTIDDYRDIKLRQAVRSTTTDVSPGQAERTSNISAMTRNGLSLYLIKRHAEENNLHLSEKLQQCVWDHIHSTHRFALLGDSNTAKLHANIASDAMKALSNYMPSEEYKQFYDDMSSHIKLHN